MLSNGCYLAKSVAAIALAVGAIVACGESGPPAEKLEHEEVSSGTPGVPPLITKHITIGEAWLAGFDMTVSDLLKMGARAQEREAIFVGRVASVDVNFDTSIIAHDPPAEETPPAGHPKAEPLITPDPNNPASGIPFSHFTVVVEQIIDAPGLTEGGSINISQLGALIDGVAYENEADPIIIVGHTYLFFLTEPRPRTWISIPQGRFEVDETGRVRPVHPTWAETPASLALRGLTVDQAVAVIEVAVANASLAP